MPDISIAHQRSKTVQPIVEIGLTQGGKSMAHCSPVFRLLTVFGCVVVVFMFATTAFAEELTPGGTFIDDDGATAEPSIEAIYEAGITVGCSDRQEFCPDRKLTRGEMAALIDRALDLPPTSIDYFTDDDNSIFEGNINRLAAAGITNGCNPPDNTRFCPDDLITRGQIAAFFVRALSLPPAIEPNKFTDDDTSMFEAAIDSLAEAGVTKGCNPPDNTNFCPNDAVTRGTMAIFLTRAVPLEPIQRMARELDGWVVLPWEEFKLWDVIGQPTNAKGYVPAPILLNGEGYCCDHPLNIGGGTSQFGTTLYNAVYWGAYDEVKHRPHTKYISRYPVGVEATLGYPHLTVDFINDSWNPIYINTRWTSTSITVEFWANNDGRTVVGWHSGGRTTIRVTSVGGEDARHVTSSVTGPVPGTVTIRRTITGPEGSETETWFHTYD